MYEFVSPDHEISLKQSATDHVLGELISKHPPGTVFTGDFPFFYPVNMEYARFGDIWLHVTHVDGVEVDGWIAVVHQGIWYGAIEFVDSPKAFEFPPRVVLEDGTSERGYVPEN